MLDITYCTSTDCPSKDCKIKVISKEFKPKQIISMADFSCVCRYYIGWALSKIEDEHEYRDNKSS